MGWGSVALSVMDREVISYKKTNLLSPGDPPLKTNSMLSTAFLLLPADMHVEEVLAKSVGTAAVERRGGELLRSP